MDSTYLLSDEAFARRIAFGLLRDRDAADDLVQEAWVEVLAHPPRHAEGLRGYLVTILRRLWSGKRRADAASRAREWLVARGEAQEETAILVARAEIHQRTVAAVLSLDEPYRTCILARFFDDLTPAQIAAREGVPHETVRTRMKRAMALLRARLEREDRDWREQWVLALGGSRFSPVAERAVRPAVRTALAAGTVAAALSVWLAWSLFAARPSEVPDPALALAARPPGGSAPPPEELTLREASDRTAMVHEVEAAPAAVVTALAGTAFDREGRPLSGVRVDIAAARWEYSPPLAYATSDAAGRFSLPLDAWNDWSVPQRGLVELTVQAWAGGHRPFARTLVAAEIEEGEFELTLEPGRMLSGRVFKPDGSPAPETRLVVHCRDAQGRLRRTMNTASLDGWFGIALEPGERVIEVAFCEHAVGFAFLDEPALPAAKDGDLELAPITLQEGHCLRGRCLLPDGTPVRNLQMTVLLIDAAADGTLQRANRPRSEFAQGHDQESLHTDSLGRFETCALRPGTYQIVSGGVPLVEGAAWDADGPEIEIVLDRRHLAVEVEGPDGRLLEEARVAVTRLTSAGGVSAQVRTITTGEPPVAIVSVEPGEELAVLAAAPGCASLEERITIGPAPFETALRLRLVPEDRRATLALRPSAGASDAWSVDLCAPLSGVPLPGLHGLVPDEEGRVAGLPAGRYRVRLAARTGDEELDAPPEFCAALESSMLALPEGETPLSFPVLRAARVRVRFGTSGESRAPASPAIPRHASSPTDYALMSWMSAAFVPARGELEVWAPELDPERPFQRATGLNPRAGQVLDLVAPAGPLRLRFVLDGHEHHEAELAPAPGETSEVVIPLAETAPQR